MSRAALASGKERGCAALGLYDQYTIIGSEPPIRRIGSAENLDATADILGRECLPADLVDVIAEQLGGNWRLQRNRSDSARHVEGDAFSCRTAREEKDIAHVAPDARHLVMNHFLVLEEHVLGPADAAGEFAFDSCLGVEVVGKAAARGIDVEVDFGIVVTADEKCP